MRRPRHGALRHGNALSCEKVIVPRFGLVGNPRHSKERHPFDKMAHKSRLRKLEVKCTLKACSWKWEFRLWVDSDSSGHLNYYWFYLELCSQSTSTLVNSLVATLFPD